MERDPYAIRPRSLTRITSYQPRTKCMERMYGLSSLERKGDGENGDWLFDDSNLPIRINYRLLKCSIWPIILMCDMCGDLCHDYFFILHILKQKGKLISEEFGIIIFNVLTILMVWRHNNVESAHHLQNPSSEYETNFSIHSIRTNRPHISRVR